MALVNPSPHAESVLIANECNPFVFVVTESCWKILSDFFHNDSNCSRLNPFHMIHCLTFGIEVIYVKSLSIFVEFPNFIFAGFAY